MYTEEIVIGGVCLLIQSDPFWEGPGLTILIGLWLPVDKKVCREQRQEANYSRWKAISESINCHIITTLACIQPEPLTKYLKNIYFKKKKKNPFIVIIPLWPENNCIVILHSCIILCVFSGSPAQESFSVPAVSPGEHRCYSNMDIKVPCFFFLDCETVSSISNKQHIKIKEKWTWYKGQLNKFH